MALRLRVPAARIVGGGKAPWPRALHVPATTRSDEEKRRARLPLQLPLQVRRLHSSAPRDSAMLVLASMGIGAVALGSSYLVEAYAQHAKQKAAAAPPPPPPGASSSADANANANASEEPASAASWFSSLFSLAKGYYEGGFEADGVTRREAALILGVRENAPKEKIREAHRRLALANHPDTGGSPYLAQKINEAKDVLMGGSKS